MIPMSIRVSLTRDTRKTIKNFTSGGQNRQKKIACGRKITQKIRLRRGNYSKISPVAGNLPATGEIFEVRPKVVNQIIVVPQSTEHIMYHVSVKHVSTSESYCTYVFTILCN